VLRRRDAHLRLVELPVHVGRPVWHRREVLRRGMYQGGLLRGLRLPLLRLLHEWLMHGLLPLEQRLPREPVLQHDHEAVRNRQLPVHYRRPVRQRPEVLRRELRRWSLLRQLGLRGQHPHLQGQQMRRRVSFGRRLSRRPVLRHHDESVFLVELPLYSRRSMWNGLQVLRIGMCARDLLWQRRLRRQHPRLYEQRMRRRMPGEHRLPRQPVLQPYDGAVRNVRLHDQLPMRHEPAVLQWLVHLVERVLFGLGLWLGPMLRREHVRGVLQVERRLPGQPVLQHRDWAVLDGLPVHD